MREAFERLAFDAAVAQRDALLDARAFEVRLQELWGWRATARTHGPSLSARLRRVKYRVGESLRVLYAVRVGEQQRLVSARTFPEGKSRRVFERARESVAAQSMHTNGSATRDGLPAVVHDPSLDTVFWTFPHDRKLTALAELDAITQRCARRIGIGTTAHAEIAGYAPEKAAAFRLRAHGQDPAAYLKLYADRVDCARAAETLLAVTNAVRSRRTPAALRVAPLLYADVERGALVTAAARGIPAGHLTARERLRAMHALGEAVAGLHSLPTDSSSVREPRLTPARVERAAALLAAACPDVAVGVRELSSRLLALHATAGGLDGGDRVLLHGDLHGRNAIWNGRGLVLIDLDQAVAGSAAHDLGSAIAALRYARIVGAIGARTEACERDALVAGYAGVRRLPSPRSLAWHTAAALLVERALRAVNRYRPEGLRALPLVVDAARRTLEEAAHA